MLSFLVAILTTQCATGINDNTQVLCGHKTMENGVSVQTNSALTLLGNSYIQGANAIYLRDLVPSNSLSPSFYLDSYNVRTAGELLRVTNGGTPVMILDYQGGLTIYGDKPIRVHGHSGTPALAAPFGGYLALAGDLPKNYQGEHGALSVGSGAHPCVAHNLIQATSGRSGVGARSDYSFNVSCRGGIYSRDLITSVELPICNNALNEPPEPNNRYGPCTGLVDAGTPYCNNGPCGTLVDGGYCHDWITMYGPAYAKAGETFGFVADVGEGCQCVPAKYDGGASPAGWFKLSDRSECRP